MDVSDKVKHMGLLLLSSKKCMKSDLIYSINCEEGNRVANKRKTVLYQAIILNLNQFYQRVTFFYIRVSPTLEEAKQLSTLCESSDIIMGDLSNLEDEHNYLHN